MKLLFTTMFTVLFCSQALANEAVNSQVSDESNKAETCSNCHNSIISLKGRGVDVIIKQTKAIQASKKPHPPAGISQLCDEDMAEIATYLNTH
jgi:cytochrome c553